ncbi:unnamed protein product [Lepeophtheirus salmonis]|uniref:(salmon louse) hypothetical protein n=1 Tax=Lepeophtheirus salmonis TaxID=72036 RepID=A0A7R8CSB9_LEPSM|nr:unnamed protein product [Lepeophtheirus salmonis]CAF2862908.1 unnamed protein product [Lepeophtheirus salmonis]
MSSTLSYFHRWRSYTLRVKVDSVVSMISDIQRTTNMLQCVLLQLLILQIALPLAFGRQSWTEEPSYIEVNPEGTVILPCLVAGKKGECRWEKDSSPIGIFPTKYEWAGAPGTGDCSLRVLNSSIEFDDGVWQCKVTASSFSAKDALISQGAQLGCTRCQEIAFGHAQDNRKSSKESRTWISVSKLTLPVNKEDNGAQLVLCTTKTSFSHVEAEGKSSSRAINGSKNFPLKEVLIRGYRISKLLIDNVTYDHQGEFVCKGIQNGEDAVLEVHFCADPLPKQSWHLGDMGSGRGIILSLQRELRISNDHGSDSHIIHLSVRDHVSQESLIALTNVAVDEARIKRTLSNSRIGKDEKQMWNPLIRAISVVIPDKSVIPPDALYVSTSEKNHHQHRQPLNHHSSTRHKTITINIFFITMTHHFSMIPRRVYARILNIQLEFKPNKKLLAPELHPGPLEPKYPIMI